MIKKLAALALCAALLCAGCAGAVGEREWAEGLSPAKPFSYVSECDLSARVGYLMTMPENDTSVPCGVNTLILYLPRTDLTAMEGTLTVNDAYGTAYAQCDLAEAEIAPMSVGDLDFYGWGSGVVVLLRLDRDLDANGTYSVNIPEGAFKLEQLEVESAALEGVKQWTFATLPYGMGERRDSFEGEAHVGDTTSFAVLLGGEAVSARLCIDTPLTLASDAGEFTSDGEVMLSYTGAGEASYSLEFYDANGRYLNGVTETVSVAS